MQDGTIVKASDHTQSVVLYRPLFHGIMVTEGSVYGVFRGRSPGIVVVRLRVILLHMLLHDLGYHEREVGVGRTGRIEFWQRPEEELREHASIRSIVRLDLTIFVTPRRQVLCCEISNL